MNWRRDILVWRPALDRFRHFAALLKGLAIRLAVGIAILLGLELLPVYIKSYELSLAAEKAARLASTNWRSNEAVGDAVYEKAQDLGLPVERSQIAVKSVLTQANVIALDSLTDPDAHDSVQANVDIEVSYVVPVELPWYTLHLKLHLHADERTT
jgi:hypothetical protein